MHVIFENDIWTRAVWGAGDECATGVTSTSTKTSTKKIRGRDDISIATWNVKTLAQTGRLQEVTHELDRYTWHVVGLCEKGHTLLQWRT